MFSKSFRMISSIKNIEQPICKECIYFLPNISENKLDKYSLHIGKGGKCLKFGEKNIITGKIIFNDSELCRKDSTKCDISGIYFEKIPHNLIKYIRRVSLSPVSPESLQ